MLPQLRELEVRFADRLAVIGVHSAKFTAEQATEAVRQAVRRHGIRHPVVNDRDFRIWREYAVRAWPTLMFVDPRGKVVGRHEGEFEAGQLAGVIEAMLQEFGAAGWLDPAPLDLGQAGAAGLEAPEGSGPLAFPGKVLVDDRGRGHITIADSNHHRLVVMGLAVMDGAVHHIVGEGTAGFRDGPPETARFNWPQGMAIDPRSGVMYVADTENHAVRRMSPDGGQITTIAGTGRQARRFRVPGDTGASPGAPARVERDWGPPPKSRERSERLRAGYSLASDPGRGGNGPSPTATEIDLSSPWDLAFLPDPQAGPALEPGSHQDPHDDRGVLFVAMAGTHQIWALDLARGLIAPFAGTGREALVDGPRETACFAQPSGLALDPQGRHLYVADSETSAVRQIELATGAVSTLLGSGLFTFGDVDGALEEARLQHPLGVCVWPDAPAGAPSGESLLVADTYNHRVKRIDLGLRESRSLVGAGAPAGYADGPGRTARFSEPGGLSYARGQIFVADTNNHRVRVVDLATGAVGTLEIDLSRRAHEPAP